MKSLLYDELRELARKILEAPEGEISSLQGDARVLYEKLTVLRYTEGLVEELRQSMEPDGQEPVQEPEDEFAPEISDGEAEDSPVNIDIDSQYTGDVPEDIHENEDAEIPTGQEDGINEPAEETTVMTVEQTVAVVQQEDAVTVEKTVRVTETKSTGRSYEDIQQSLFGDDLFTKELDFDPDEDLFEDKNDARQQPEEAHLTEQTSGSNPSQEDAPASEGTAFVDDTVDALENPQEREEESELSSFFSFQVVRDEEVAPGVEGTEDPEPEKTGNEAEEEPGPAEKTVDRVEDEPKEKWAEDTVEGDKNVPHPSESGQEEIADDISESKNGQTEEAPVSQEEPAERSRTVNDTVAQKEEKRPSLNEILAASDVKMDLNDRIAFINHLFDGDAEAFETSVSYIFSLTDIDVANEYIIEILKPSYNNWFEKEKYERRFAEIVLRHFMNKK